MGLIGRKRIRQKRGERMDLNNWFNKVNISLLHSPLAAYDCLGTYRNEYHSSCPTNGQSCNFETSFDIFLI